MIHRLLDPILRAAGPKYFEALVNNHLLILPRELRGLIGVDRASRKGIYFEPPAMKALQAILKPQMTVFDVGCSYGLLTCLMAKITTPQATIHAFEANEEVLAWAKQVCEKNQCVITSTHACMGESDVGHAEFYSVPGSNSVASTRNAEIRHFHQNAAAAKVPMLSIDAYCETTKTSPSCIKIDVEGSEFQVIRGAAKTIQRLHPELIIETHGLEINGIGGSVLELAEALAAQNYFLCDLTREDIVSPSLYARRHATSIGYLLATNNLSTLDQIRRVQN